jgi:2'-5' RNA ligase
MPAPREHSSIESPRAKGTSLWLAAQGETQARLAALIARLAVRLGTEPFAPHVTLLPGLPGPAAQVLGRASSLARDLAPLRLKLTTVEGGDDPFRCLFVRVKHTAALLAAHARAARAFQRDPDPEFLPHLSLVYGSLRPEQKASLAREIAGEATGEIEVRRLCVLRTEGGVADWRELAVLQLEGPSRQGRPTATSPTSGGSDR